MIVRLVLDEHSEERPPLDDLLERDRVHCLGVRHVLYTPVDTWRLSRARQG